MPQWIKLNFQVFLLLLGLALLLVVVLDVSVRGPDRFPTDPVWNVPGGDAARGRMAVIEHGCVACHIAPDIRHPRGRVGPSLIELPQQVFIAGVVPNTPENLMQWIQHPQDVNPLTAMPNLGVTQDEARDMAAYLLNPEPESWTWRWRWLSGE